ncbi:MAG: ABC-F family ATP-binding cassette domain-containing protein [Elusimicrobia bacterium]|nr:ABC-F family ATP-binding cassette domain-containing protein [Elusimicrobiota bacterium]
MVTLRNVCKSFGEQALFEGACLQINQGDRFVLVGANGSGKSTLLRIMAGQEEADGGEITFRRGVTAGYLPQENAPVSERTVLETVLSDHDGHDARTEARAKAVLMGLGFKTSDFNRGLDSLSGGWAMRAAMAKLLLSRPDLILLDEPTNHLDIDALFWLQKHLQSCRGAVFVVSHERGFINAVGKAVASLQDRAVKVYHGDYEHYLAEREAQHGRLLAAWKRQQDEIAAMQDFIDRNRARVSTASRAQSMIKRLDRLERIELPPDAKTVKIKFPQPSRAAVRVLSLKKVAKSYGEVRVYEGLDFELERGWKVALVGHNGAGKSTLMKLLAGVLAPDAGARTLGDGVRAGYYSQHREGQLNPEKTVLQEAQSVGRLNAELFTRTVLGTFLFPGDTVFKKVGILSGGEKSRLALVKFLLDPPNVLLLDEPTTHLDMTSVEALIDALSEFEGTICCISHDLYFVNRLADHVAHVDAGKVTWYPGNYEYFKRRQAQWHEENPQAVDLPPEEKKAPAPLAQAPPAKPSAKDERKAAKRRAKLEDEVLRLHERLEALATQLGDPALYSDYAKVQALGAEMEQVQAGLKAAEEEIGRA